MAQPTDPISARSRRTMAGVLAGVAVLVVAYWVAWFTHRSLVAAESSVP